MSARVLVLAATLAGLAACAAPPPPPPPVAEAPPPAPAPPRLAGGINGMYRGTVVRTKMVGRGQCRLPGDAATPIRNNTVIRFWNRIRLEAPVQPDGSFSAESGRARMQGHVGDGTLDYTLGNEYCELHFTLTRVQPAR